MASSMQPPAASSRPTPGNPTSQSGSDQSTDSSIMPNGTNSSSNSWPSSTATTPATTAGSKRKACTSVPTKTEAKDDNDVTGVEKTGASNQKRRRRVFSCQSCQRLKCRCEYDPGSQACHRCVTLRIECSLKGEVLDASSYQKPTVPESSIEERLSRHEKSLGEIKGMIEFISRQFGLISDIHKSPKAVKDNVETDTPESNVEDDGPEQLADPVDLGIASAPTVVVRGIGEHVTQGYRKLEHVKLDLVQLQLLDEQLASDLVRLFFKHHQHLVLVYNPTDSPSGDIREVSAFLHSVCCLCAILYREDLCGTPVHREVYNQVRITLGQTLLSSPLKLEEINAVLVMSDHADGPEYIDSWLLTGYCVKQAMLSISFSKIVKNIKRGTATLSDRRAMHLWSTICLHHLHWASTTGRPSVLQTGYINQCNILLSFYQASMQDGMLVAEILLYSALHQKLTRRSYLDSNGECEEFRSWKQKWNHLMVLSTASMLRIGYYAAHLYLAVRALEESGHAMSPKKFLSNLSLVGTEKYDQQSADAESKNNTSTLHLNTSRYAHAVLETFMEMPPFLMDSIPTYLCLCIGYSALILAHYDESQSKVSSEVSIQLISRLEAWCMRTPSKSWGIKFAKLARQKVESRTGSRIHPELRSASMNNDRRHLPGWDNRHMSMPAFGLATDTTSSPVPQSRPFEGQKYGPEEYASPADGFPLESDQIQPGYDPQAGVIPSMEDIFRGGFLDFMRQPRS